MKHQLTRWPTSKDLNSTSRHLKSQSLQSVHCVLLLGRIINIRQRIVARWGARCRLRADADQVLRLGITGHRFVVAHWRFAGVLPLPARATKVPETRELSTKIWAVLHSTRRAQRVLQIGIDLEDFTLKLGRTNVNEGCCDGLKIGVAVVECYACRTEWVLVFVGVNSWE